MQLTDQELEQRLQWWISQQTYNQGVFDADPEFRPAWSRYHRLWEVHLYDPDGTPPLAAVWLPRQAAEFEEARRGVLAVMIAELRAQPGPDELLGRLLEALAAAAEAKRQPGALPAG